MGKETKIKQKFLNNPDNIATILGLVGVVAIVFSMFFRGFSVNNILDAVKDIMGLSISVGIYWLANRIYFSKKQQREFHELFEEKLHDWAENNKYLIDPRCLVEKGRLDKDGNLGDHYRYYQMVTDHSRLIEMAEAISESDKKKGVFIKLPFAKQEEGYNSIRFFFTKSVFVNPDKGVTELKPIIEKISNQLSIVFSQSISGISFMPKSSEILVDISRVDKSPGKQDESVEKLINLIDFVKILYLAQA